MFYAHSVPGRSRAEWQLLEVHLQAVAHLSQTFAAAFDSADWGRLVGLWHDLGKYRPEFQSHISGEAARVDHSIVGALLAMSKHPQAGLPLALAIAGHHGAGLANLLSSEVTPPTPLKERLQANANLLAGLLPSIPDAIKNLPLPPMPACFGPAGGLADGRSLPRGSVD